MKYAWEQDDINESKLARRECEIVLVNSQGITSMRDGHRWLTKATKSEIADYLNREKYLPCVKYLKAYECIAPIVHD